MNINGKEYDIKPYANLRGADLSWANLSGANLSGSDLSGSDLHGANLSGADLSWANLSGANLSRANLSRANLSGSDLSRANLSGANLRGANLSGANLSGSDLSWADLHGANLSGADLSGANLRGANLSGAKIDKKTNDMFSIVPEHGAFTGWKKCKNGVIVKLQITANAKRSSAASRKCRASAVKVLQVIGGKEGFSWYDPNIVYKKGKRVKCHDWNPDKWVECGGGIHFFLTRSEAENYEF